MALLRVSVPPCENMTFFETVKFQVFEKKGERLDVRLGMRGLCE
jgi:hypothetical protein